MSYSSVCEEVLMDNVYWVNDGFNFVLFWSCYSITPQDWDNYTSKWSLPGQAMYTYAGVHVLLLCAFGLKYMLNFFKEIESKHIFSASVFANFQIC